MFAKNKSSAIALAEINVLLKNISSRIESQASETEQIKKSLFTDENSVSNKLSLVFSQLNELTKDTNIVYDRVTDLEAEIKVKNAEAIERDEELKRYVAALDKTVVRLEDKASQRDRLQQIVITALAAVLVPIAVNYVFKLSKITHEPEINTPTSAAAAEIAVGYSDKKSVRTTK